LGTVLSTRKMTDTLRDRVVEIIRRDLKLGANFPIADDQPLFNSEADLDSLDLLLMVSSLEREFGFKIPSEAMGETVFRSVSSLTEYVRLHQKNGSPAPVAAVAVPVNPLDRLPHADPFRFVSRVVRITADDSAEGVWSVTGKEPFFAGHFPGNPIVPGVLIIESLAQLCGLISPPASAGASGKLVHVDVRFESSAKPPADITLTSRLVRKVVSLQQFEVSAAVGPTTIARGTLALQLVS
jgi:3-hydroxyacyl-[acyl-carrier-protein] dehydratase